MKLQLIHPARPLWFTQVFGGNEKTYKQFGLKGHNGLDWLAIHGQPIYAAHEGDALYSIDKNNGHLITVSSRRQYELLDSTKAYIKTVYGHLVDSTKEPKYTSPVFKAKNMTKTVKAGELIGYADNTGFSTGDHLHFGLKPMGKDKKGNFYNLFQDNGFKGAIDPFPYLVAPLPPDVLLPYEDALALLRKGGLPKLVLPMAEWVLRKKYNR